MALEGVGANFQFCHYYGGNAQPKMHAEAMGESLARGRGEKAVLKVSFSLCVRAHMCVICDYVSGVSLQSK